jgi:hypothetical protein
VVCEFSVVGGGGQDYCLRFPEMMVTVGTADVTMVASTLLGRERTQRLQLECKLPSPNSGYVGSTRTWRSLWEAPQDSAAASSHESGARPRRDLCDLVHLAQWFATMSGHCPLKSGWFVLQYRLDALQGKARALTDGPLHMRMPMIWQVYNLWVVQAVASAESRHGWTATHRAWACLTFMDAFALWLACIVHTRAGKLPDRKDISSVPEVFAIVRALRPRLFFSSPRPSFS